MGQSVGFGIVEFGDVMGVIRAMKLLNGKIFKGKRIEVHIPRKPKQLVCRD